METLAKSLVETEALASSVLATVAEREREEAVVLALYGDLGSGKTTFTQYIASELGVRDYVTSPTFVIQKRYQTKNPIFKKLIHIDCYRLNSPAEILALDWAELLADKDNLLVVEWAERIEAILPTDVVKIKFETAGELERKIAVIGL